MAPGGDNKDVGASAPSGKKSAAGLASTFTDSNFVSVDQHAEDNEYEDSLRTDSSARVVDYPGALPGLAVGYEQQQDPKGFWEEVKDEYHYCKRSIERNFQKLNRKTSHLTTNMKRSWSDTQRRRITKRDVADTMLPCLIWMRKYNLLRDLPCDLISGFSVGFMVVPQGLSYAALVGVPPIYGLYAALVPVVIHTFLASSLQLCVGPVAITSLMYGDALTPLFPSIDFEKPASDPMIGQYIAVVLQVAFLVGLMEFTVGVLRLGWVTQLLSNAVIVGFTSGAGIIIALSQFKFIFGIKMPRADTLQKNISYISDNIDGFQWQTFVIGMGLIALIYTFTYVGRWINKRHPIGLYISYMGPLAACVVGITLTWGFNVNTPIVGKIPKGLPPITFGDIFPMFELGTIFPKALLIAGVAILESIAISKVLAQKNKYDFCPNTELRALGVSNIIGCGFAAYAATGSFSRSAVIKNTGGKTPLTGLFACSIVFLTLVALTQVLYWMPKCGMGAIIITGALSLIDFKSVWYIFRVDKKDFCVWLVSFVGVLTLGIELGLGVAVGLALLLLIYDSAYPHTAILGRVPGSEVFKDVKRYPNATVSPDTLIFRMDADLYFASADNFKDMVYHSMKKQSNRFGGEPVTNVILDMSTITHMDTTGLNSIHDLIGSLQRNNPPGKLGMACANKRIQTLFAKDRVNKLLLGGEIFDSVYEAALAANRESALKKGEQSTSKLDCKTDGAGVCTHKCPEGVWDLVKSEKPWQRPLEEVEATDLSSPSSTSSPESASLPQTPSMRTEAVDV